MLTIAQDVASRSNSIGECESYTMTPRYDYTGLTVLFVSIIHNSRHMWVGHDDAVLGCGEIVKQDLDGVIYQLDPKGQWFGVIVSRFMAVQATNNQLAIDYRASGRMNP